MAEVGDRVEFASAQAAPRVGVVLAVTGSMVRIRWDTGGESSMVPGPGVLSVVPAAKKAAKKAPAKKAPAKKTPVAKAAPEPMASKKGKTKADKKGKGKRK
jgi:hypothetical protein